MGQEKEDEGEEEEEEEEERDVPRANSLLAGSARSAMPNPGGTAYTPFPAHPLDESTLHSPSFYPAFSHPSPTPESFRDSCLFPSFVSHSLVRCTKLQFIAISLALIRPSLLPPLSSLSHSGFLTPTAEAAETPTSDTSYATLREYSVLLPPALREYSHGCLLRSSPILPISLSLPLAVPCAVGRSARRSVATGVANSLLATSAPLGRFRAPPEEFASMRRAALPASCT